MMLPLRTTQMTKKLVEIGPGLSTLDTCREPPWAPLTRTKVWRVKKRKFVTTLFHLFLPLSPEQPLWQKTRHFPRSLLPIESEGGGESFVPSSAPIRQPSLDPAPQNSIKPPPLLLFSAVNVQQGTDKWLTLGPGKSIHLVRA